MAGGWGNYIMQDQPSFTVLDSFMMLINVFLLACFPPGLMFPHMAKQAKASPMEEAPETVKPGEDGHDSEQGGLKFEQDTKAPSPVPES